MSLSNRRRGAPAFRASIRAVLPTCLAAMACTGPAAAATLTPAEIKAASEKKGCETIPYVALRNQCIATQAKIEACKKALVKDFPTQETKALERVVSDVKKNNREIDALRQKQEATSASKHSSSVKLVLLRDSDKEILKLHQDNEALIHQQEARDLALNLPKTIALANECVGHRVTQRETFAKAKGMLERGADFPHSPTEHKQAVEDSKQSIKEITNGEADHLTQEVGWRNRADAWEAFAKMPRPVP